MNFLRTARVAPERQIHHLLADSFICGGQGDDMAEKRLTYFEQLKHPKWQRKRLEVLEIAGFECEDCGSNEKTLHVHHRQYFKGRMAWEYGNEELAVLCDECHEMAHSVDDRLKQILAVTGSNDALAMVAGFYAHAQILDSAFMCDVEQHHAWGFFLGLLAGIAVHVDAKGLAAGASAMLAHASENSEAFPKYDAFIDHLKASGGLE